MTQQQQPPLPRTLTRPTPTLPQVSLFSEEVVRGSAAFAVSLRCTRLDPLLRATAEMGSWMIISPGAEESVTGRVVVVQDLSTIQEKVYDEPTILLVNQVR
jgi:alpha-glucan,water dikinase